MQSICCAPFHRKFSALAGFAFIALSTSPSRAAQPTWDYAVQVEAAVQANPPLITLRWPQDTTTLPTSHTVFRKTPAAATWGAGIALAGTATSYIDSTVAIGTVYEYQIIRENAAYSAFGYIQSGIAVPLTDDRGKVVLIVERTAATGLVSELARLQQDLVGDGWTVLRHDVSRTDSVASVKQLIKADYLADPARVKSVFLFGRVPVPYSGMMAPDGHTEHYGAWPADAYYGDMDGTWTDSNANFIQSGNADPADNARLTNLPGDGKFDPLVLPSPVELQVGRVDLANMPGRVAGVATFPGELELLRRYLNKDHNYRHRLTTVPRRAAVADYFGLMNGEAFAASGYRNFAPLVGTANVANLNLQYADAAGVWIPTLAAGDHLFAFGSGPGTYTSASSIGSTTDLVANNVRVSFALLCGSWFGDWDHEDNFLRAILATPDSGLAAMWSGRPHWYLHPMGLGETIGHAARLTQNNGTHLYSNQTDFAAGWTHVALMGDPTLRLYPIAPGSTLNATLTGTTAALTWSASPDSVLGYHVYRATSAAGPFARLTSTPVTTTSIVDSAASAGLIYMVRAVKLETSPSGTYHHASQGIFFTLPGTPPVANPSPRPVTSPITTAWLEDALPSGATMGASGGDGWHWITSSPAPFRGTKAHQSRGGNGTNEHWFDTTRSPLTIATGDTLFTYVWLDPKNPPQEIMVTWRTAAGDHCAFWGADKIATSSRPTIVRAKLGALPATGHWVRLEIPAGTLALSGRTVSGMKFSLYNGSATWDCAGKVSQ